MSTRQRSETVAVPKIPLVVPWSRIRTPPRPNRDVGSLSNRSAIPHPLPWATAVGRETKRENSTLQQGRPTYSQTHRQPNFFPLRRGTKCQRLTQVETGVIRFNVFRPKGGDRKFPVLVTYGKDIRYKE